jgi:hypothetical protein
LSKRGTGTSCLVARRQQRVHGAQQQRHVVGAGDATRLEQRVHVGRHPQPVRALQIEVVEREHRHAQARVSRQ